MEKEKNKVIAFIPARGGSKGIKNKNIVDLDGIPLVMWSVFAAATSKKVDQIVVSSDSDEILTLVNIYERHIDKDIKLLKRHQDLSEDSSTTESVIDDFIHNYQDIDDNNIIILLQPTSPFRHNDIIDRIVSKVIQPGSNSSVTVSERSPFFWRMYMDRESISPLYDPGGRKRRQDMSCVDLKVQEDGNIYGFTVGGFKRDGHRSPFRTSPVIVDQIHSIEIDEYLDLEICRAIAQMEIIQKWKKNIVV
tara:strand:- start:2147 stop:2893 length:747 start_codon:yes stop_codon:yes gene_type:complete